MEGALACSGLLPLWPQLLPSPLVSPALLIAVLLFLFCTCQDCSCLCVLALAVFSTWNMLHLEICMACSLTPSPPQWHLLSEDFSAVLSESVTPCHLLLLFPFYFSSSFLLLSSITVCLTSVSYKCCLSPSTRIIDSKRKRVFFSFFSAPSLIIRIVPDK